MDIAFVAVLLGALAFFAHIVKGLTGFGPAIIFVSIGSVVYNPIEVIVLAALLDIIGGGTLTALNPQFLRNSKYWAPIGLLMVIGAISGSLLLSIAPASAFEIVLGVAIVVISIWFLFGNSEPDGSASSPTEIKPLDGFVGSFSGFCGGFTGMGGPPLIVYLGAKFKKDFFRAIIVPIFLVSAIARFTTYGALGMVDLNNYLLYILPPIGVIIGNFVGNHFFDYVEQRWFTVLIGVILLLSGTQLILN